MIQGLADSYSEIADYIKKQLKLEGDEIIPLLKKNFDPQGKKEMLKRFEVIRDIAKEKENDFYKYCIENGNKNIKELAIEAISYEQKNIDYLLDLVKAEKGALKNKAYESLANMADQRAIDIWKKFVNTRDIGRCKYLENSTQDWATELMADMMEKYLEELPNLPQKTSADKAEISSTITDLSLISMDKANDRILDCYVEFYPYIENVMQTLLEYLLITKPSDKLFEVIETLAKKYKNKLTVQEFLCSLICDDAKTVFKNYSKELDTKKLLSVMTSIFYDKEKEQYFLKRWKPYIGPVICVLEHGFDERWYPLIFEKLKKLEKREEYDIRDLYNPNIKSLNKIYGEYYYQYIYLDSTRSVSSRDLDYLDYLIKIGWNDFKHILTSFLGENTDYKELSFRIQYLKDEIQRIPISEDDLKKEVEVLLEQKEKLGSHAVKTCETWLEKLNSGMKVKEL